LGLKFVRVIGLSEEEFGEISMIVWKISVTLKNCVSLYLAPRRRRNRLMNYDLVMKIVFRALVLCAKPLVLFLLRDKCCIEFLQLSLIVKFRYVSRGFRMLCKQQLCVSIYHPMRAKLRRVLSLNDIPLRCYLLSVD